MKNFKHIIDRLGLFGFVLLGVAGGAQAQTVSGVTGADLACYISFYNEPVERFGESYLLFIDLDSPSPRLWIRPGETLPPEYMHFSKPLPQDLRAVEMPASVRYQQDGIFGRTVEEYSGCDGIYEQTHLGSRHSWNIEATLPDKAGAEMWRVQIRKQVMQDIATGEERDLCEAGMLHVDIWTSRTQDRSGTQNPPTWLRFGDRGAHCSEIKPLEQTANARPNELAQYQGDLKTQRLEVRRALAEWLAGALKK